MAPERSAAKIKRTDRQKSINTPLKKMMKPEQEFDKIIRQRIEESESQFAFDEGNWQKAAKLMGAERGAAGFRNNKKFLLAGALCLFMGSVLFFGYKFLNQDDINGQQKQVSDQSITNEVAVNKSMSGTIGANEKQITESSVASKLQSENESNENSVPAKVSTSENDKITTSSESPAKINNGSAVSVKNPGSSAGNKSPMNPEVNSSKNKTISNFKNNTETEITTSNSSVSEVQVVENNDGANMYENLFLNTKVTKMPAHNLDGDLRKTSYDFIRIYKDDFYTRKRKTCYLDIEAGTTYMFGWDTKAGKDAAGFNAYAGLNFGFHIRKKISASVGAQLYNVGNIKQPFYTGSSVNYDFGANGTYTTITTNNLAYFAIPVKIIYAIDKRNTVGLGANTALLFNGQNTVETYSMSDGVRSNLKTQNNTGYYEGTNTTNVTLTGFYSRAVTRRMKLNAEVMYGVNDIFGNTALKTTNERSTGVRLGIQYTLFSK
jgi:hypothetical protein